jgi:hypothetical protein
VVEGQDGEHYVFWQRRTELVRISESGHEPRTQTNYLYDFVRRPTEPGPVTEQPANDPAPNATGSAAQFEPPNYVLVD